MTPPPRIVVIGDLEATRLLCTLLTEEGAETVHLLAPDEPSLRTAFAEDVAGVAVIVRGDVVALRYALLAESLQPAVPMVVSVFDRTIGRQLASVVPNCTVTSPADVAAPSVVAACVRPDALAVLPGGTTASAVVDRGGVAVAQPWSPQRSGPRERLARWVPHRHGGARRPARRGPDRAGLDHRDRVGAGRDGAPREPPGRLLRVDPAGRDRGSGRRVLPRCARLVPRRLGAAHAHRHRLHRGPGGRARRVDRQPTYQRARRATQRPRRPPRGDRRAGAGRAARRSAAARAAGAVRGRRADPPGARTSRWPARAGFRSSSATPPTWACSNGSACSSARALAALGSDDLDNVAVVISALALSPGVQTVLRAGEDPAVEETTSLFRIGRVADVSAMTAAWVCASVRGEQPVVAYAHAGTGRCAHRAGRPTPLDPDPVSVRPIPPGV